MKLITLLSFFILATNIAQAKSLYCRLSHNLKNNDFQMEYPALEPGPYNMGGLIGKTTKNIQTKDASFEVSVTLIDLNGMTFGNPKKSTDKSLGLDIKLLTDDVMPYSVSAGSNTLLKTFEDQIDSSITLDTSPLAIDKKYFLWCKSTPIQ